MADYSIGAYEFGQIITSDFGEFIEIVKGRSIVSGADWGNDRLELGLSGNLMVRFFRTDTGMTINLISTRNRDENPTLVIDMGDMQKRVPISIIEKKLNALRTLYAIFYLVYDDRAGQLEQFLRDNPNGDIEQSLLTPDESLFIESISYGSWVLTVWAKTKKAYKSVVSVAGLVFNRGREAFLKKLEADARLKEAEAQGKEIENRDKNFELNKKQMDYLLEASEKMEAPEIKEQLKLKMIEATKTFTLGDKSDNNSYRQLGQ